MKRDSDSLEVIPPTEGLSVSTMEGLSSPPMKKICLDERQSTATDRMEGVTKTAMNLLSSSGLSSPPMKSPIPYTTGGAEVAEGGASPQPATEAEEKEAEATSLPESTRQFPCVWLNGAGGVDTSPTKPAYDNMPIVSFNEIRPGSYGDLHLVLILVYLDLQCRLVTELTLNSRNKSRTTNESVSMTAMIYCVCCEIIANVGKL